MTMEPTTGRDKVQGHITMIKSAVGEAPAASLNVHTREATRVLFKAFRIGGINPPEKYKIMYYFYGVFVNLLVSIYLPVGFILSYTVMSDVKMSTGEILNSLQAGLNVCVCSVKFLALAFLLPHLKSAEKPLALLDARCRNQDDIAELQKIVRLGNRLIIFFFFAYFNYVTCNFLFAFFNGLPSYGIYNPFWNWRASPTQFRLAAFTEWGLISFACIQNAANDAYALIYVSILRTHMKILLLRVKKLGSNPNFSLQDNFEELKLCIKDHKNLLGLYDIVAPVISVTLFIQLLVSGTVLGMVFFNILIFATDSTSRITSCLYIFSLVVEILPLSYAAQCLTYDHNRLSEVIFHSNWMDQDVRYRKMLIFFMQRAQRTMEFTAGKMVPINLSTCLAITRLSFSLYTIIKKANIK